ncbi:hypothetical protein ACFOFO_26465 [Undibacterium arcticum]|uniref:Uncharacterized protein n=1 Tax=Undibacterium arcticum TaxID=1762892 RepID=A0ABV7F8S3_9BURK
MAIQLRGIGGSVSVALYSNDLVPDVYPKAVTIDIRAGDWKAYIHHITGHHDNKDFVSCYGGVVAYQRQCAMAYLGKRAQLHGGVCSRTQPRILTPQCIADLDIKNKAQRYQRYPWLEKLLNLLAEIERIQDKISGGDVISWIPAVK